MDGDINGINFFVYRDFAALKRSIPGGCPYNVRRALLDCVVVGTISDIEAAKTAQSIALAIQEDRR